MSVKRSSLLKLINSGRKSFSRSYIVGHHDGEQSLVGSVDGHVQGGGLEQDEKSVKDDVGDGQQEVRNDADVFPLPQRRLRRRPEQRVDGVLAEGRKESVTNLEDD